VMRSRFTTPLTAWALRTWRIMTPPRSNKNSLLNTMGFSSTGYAGSDEESLGGVSAAMVVVPGIAIRIKLPASPKDGRNFLEPPNIVALRFPACADHRKR